MVAQETFSTMLRLVAERPVTRNSEVICLASDYHGLTLLSDLYRPVSVSGEVFGEHCDGKDRARGVEAPSLRISCREAGPGALP
jgi:hypothetical protein